MISSISSSASSSALLGQKLFAKIDVNGDGSVTRDEFVSSRPKGVSETQAGELFTTLDTGGTGSLTQTQFSQGMAASKSSEDSSSAGASGELSSETLAALLQLLQTVTGGEASGSIVGAAGGTPPSADDMFTMMDTDADGVVSEEEFLAAKPDDVSDEQALALFNSIDTENTGSITSEQFTASIAAGPAAGGGGGPPPSSSEDEDDSSTATYDALDTNQDGKVSLDELLAGLLEETGSSANEQAQAMLTEMMNAIQAYTSNQNQQSARADARQQLVS